MSKQEIKAALKAKGIFDTNTRDQLWTDAFKMYENETRMKLSQSCGSCWTRIRNWLNG